MHSQNHTKRFKTSTDTRLVRRRKTDIQIQVPNWPRTCSRVMGAVAFQRMTAISDDSLCQERQPTNLYISSIPKSLQCKA